MGQRKYIIIIILINYGTLNFQFYPIIRCQIIYVPEKEFLFLETSQDLSAENSNYIFLLREQNAGQTTN